MKSVEVEEGVVECFIGQVLVVAPHYHVETLTRKDLWVTASVLPLIRVVSAALTGAGRLTQMSPVCHTN